MPRVLLVLALLLVLPACGSQRTPRPADGIPRLSFDYDVATPLRYVDRGRVNHGYPIGVHDISFVSQGRRIAGYLLLPPGSKPLPAVIFVHGSSGDRTQLLGPAAWLAGRGVVTLTVTEPSSASQPTPAAGAAFLRQQRDLVVRDVVAIRRAVDLLRSLARVDRDRIGYVGWSAGAKQGAFVAAAEPRVRALVLMSAGADPIAAFVAGAPARLKRQVREVLGSVDPLRYVAWARPGTILLENGSADRVVPRRALRNMIRAAPRGTPVRWYRAGHDLNAKAFTDAFDWLARKLAVAGPPVAGAKTGP